VQLASKKQKSGMSATGGETSEDGVLKKAERKKKRKGGVQVNERRVWGCHKKTKQRAITRTPIRGVGKLARERKDKSIPVEKKKQPKIL